MPERSGITAFKGNPLTLLGEEVAVGQEAPDATVLDNDLQPVSISFLRGKKLIIASVPSLDTPVCDMEVRRFNQEASRLGEGVEVLTISMDLPFPPRRFLRERLRRAHQGASAAGARSVCGGCGRSHPLHPDR